MYCKIVLNNKTIHSLTTNGDSLRVSFFVHSSIVLLSPPFVSPPERQDGMRCD